MAENLGPNADPDAKEVVLGEKYRDVVTGFEGTAVIKMEHLNGCLQYVLEPGLDDDGKLRPQAMFDEQRLVDVSGERVATEAPPGNAWR